MARKRAAPVVEPEPSSEEEEEVEEEVEEEEVEEEEEEVEEDGDEEVEEEVEEEDDDEEADDDDEEEEEDEKDSEQAGRKDGSKGAVQGKSESSLRETIRQLLDPFGKDQLIEFLNETVRKNPALLERISASAESDPTHRKIFVHGLGWDATTEILAAAFREFGEIEECRVVSDRMTGKSKGYGFVLFRTRAGAQSALKEPQKKIGNRMAACQLASHGPVPSKKFFPGLNPTLPGVAGQAVAGLGNAAVQSNDLSLTPPLAGFNPIGSAINQNMYSAGLAVQQSTRIGGIGGLNPTPTASAAGISSTLNRPGTTPTFGTGLSYAGASQGINSISPNVISNYGSQSGLQGLGGYQTSQLPTSTGIRSHSAIGTLGANFPHYLGR